MDGFCERLDWRRGGRKEVCELNNCRYITSASANVCVKWNHLKNNQWKSRAQMSKDQQSMNPVVNWWVWFAHVWLLKTGEKKTKHSEIKLLLITGRKIGHRRKEKVYFPLQWSHKRRLSAAFPLEVLLSGCSFFSTRFHLPSLSIFFGSVTNILTPSSFKQAHMKTLEKRWNVDADHSVLFGFFPPLDVPRRWLRKDDMKRRPLELRDNSICISLFSSAPLTAAVAAAAN